MAGFENVTFAAARLYFNKYDDPAIDRNQIDLAIRAPIVPFDDGVAFFP